MTAPQPHRLHPIPEASLSQPERPPPTPTPSGLGPMARNEPKSMEYDDDVMQSLTIYQSYEELPPNFSVLENCAAGAFAGIAEHSVMYPVDMLKTRLQVLKPAEGGLYTGLTNAFLKVRRVEGWGRLWRGPAHAVYFLTYETVKHATGGNESGYHLVSGLASGGSATIASDALMNPFDVIKQRMQVHGSTYRSVFQCLRTVYKNEGLRAFYASYPTTITMTVPFTALQFMAYENLSVLLNPTKEYSPNTHILAGGLAGGFAAALTTPLDVIKTLLQTRGTAQDPELRLARGLFGAASIIKRLQGWSGFFRGLQPRILTAVPATAICCPMMRNKASSSMQKTYDDCYLVCSTAVYFEGQNNEAEALRSWRSALDQISYHNAYRVPPNYIPKNETERALQESLRNMEMQCKERVELLEALRKSRKEAEKKSKEGQKSSGSSSSQRRPAIPPKLPSPILANNAQGWMGDGRVPPVVYPDLSRNPPPLPLRPALPKKATSSPTERSYSTSNIPTVTPSQPAYTPPTLPVPLKKTSRTPSPDKKGGHVMLTTLRGHKDAKGKPSKPSRSSGNRVPHASSKAAGLAWDSVSKASGQKLGQGLGLGGVNGSTATLNSPPRDITSGQTTSRPNSANLTEFGDRALGGNALVQPRTRTPPDVMSMQEPLVPSSLDASQRLSNEPLPNADSVLRPQTNADLITLEPQTPTRASAIESKTTKTGDKSPAREKLRVDYPSYRTEFPPMVPSSRATAEFNARIARQEEGARTSNLPARQQSPQRKARPPLPSGVSRRPVANSSSPRLSRNDRENGKFTSSESNDETTGSEVPQKKWKAPHKQRNNPVYTGPGLPSPENEKNDDGDLPNPAGPPKTWDERVKYIQKHLPKGVDEHAAKQIFNEIVVKGDEVHWDDVAGLEAAKTALKEAVVYPFLRPDLFMGLREPARGMLLFGPPGTGKTMLARAVATESRSTFFAISASSLTSKWLGESEKLVRALFLLAKALAPSIIFVDEIDSLLSSRGGPNEHESTRRIKTEFLIQWSDLQRAAAGKQQSDKEKAEGDASRVLVLAATNMPWAIDEAARRRFVRRQYIPLPEAPVRGEQLRTLLGHQKHSLNRKDIQVLVELTDGFSGSDITALAKDAAMGPLRSLGEALLYMSMDEIRPINFSDFEASLINIRPSVSKQGLQEFEDWAKEFGERGG
ncbi:MAG: hypothetical protein Q9163_002330 [Psora crenata]